MQEYFEVGQIVNTFGIKGQLKVKPFTDSVGFAPFFVHVASFSLSITIVDGFVIGSYEPIFSIIFPSLGLLESATTMW